MDAVQRESTPIFGIVLDFHPRQVLLRGREPSAADIETRRADRRNPMIREPSASLALDAPQSTGNRR
jgi:hypothetical protein